MYAGSSHMHFFALPNGRTAQNPVVSACTIPDYLFHSRMA